MASGKLSLLFSCLFDLLKDNKDKKVKKYQKNKSQVTKNYKNKKSKYKKYKKRQKKTKLQSQSSKVFPDGPGKQTRPSVPKIREGLQATHPSEQIFLDLCGGFNTVCGKKGYVPKHRCSVCQHSAYLPHPPSTVARRAGKFGSADSAELVDT
jgi:hypothetical protein